MKRKISKIFGVGLALVLVLSLSLVAAAPVAASPDVSDVRVELSDYLHSQASDYHIYFTPGVDLAKDVDTITILFPAGTTSIDDITDAVDTDLLVDEDGDAIWSARTATQAASEVAGYRVVVTTPVDIAADTEARIDIIGSGITNPTTEGAYQVAVWTSQETTHVDSASYTIGLTSVIATDFDPANEINDVAAEAGTVGLTDSYLVMFEVSATGALALDWGTITVIFPPDTTVPSSISADSVYVNPATGTGMLLDTDFTVCTEAPVVDGRKVTVKTAVVILDSALAAVYFTSDAGIGNPTCSTDANNTTDPTHYVGKVYTSEDTGSQRQAFSETINAASASAIVFDPDSDTSVVVDVAADFDIWTIDMYGNMSEVPVEVDIDIISSSATGEFHDHEAGSYEDWELTPSTVQVVVDTWKTNATGEPCQYRDSTAGTYTLTASYGTWTPVTCDMEVVEAEVHVVELYDGDVLINTYDTIALAINDALDGNVIKVGPGTYTPASTLIISQEGLTLESTDDAAVTIIDASTAGTAISITADDVTVDGFTVQNPTTSGISSSGSADGTVIQNNIVTVEGENPADAVMGIALEGSTTNVLVTGNQLNEYSTMYLISGISDCTLSDNTFGAGINLEENNSNITITDNTIIGSACEGISFNGTGHDNILIQGNTISETTVGGPGYGPGAGIYVRGTVSDVVIKGNDITDNEEVGIKITGTWTTGNVIKFNTISGNTDYGIENTTSTDVDATHNYWGDDTGPSGEGTGMGDAISTDVGYEPWFVTTVSAGEWATGVASLDARATVGVKVSGATPTDQKIGVARYTENPMATPEFTPLTDGFFDVYVFLAGDTNEIGIKFYADGMTAQSKVYVWDFFEEVWAECSNQLYNATYGYIWVKVHQAGIDVPTVPTISDLAGTPFAISTEEVGVRTLQSIAVTPATASIIVGGTKQFTATGTYNLAPLTEDITATVTWASSVTSVANIVATGLATGVAEGTTNITATLDTIVSPAAVLTVSVWDPLEAYDDNEDGVIDKTEAVAALMDYLFYGSITKANAVEVLILYLGI